MNTIELCYMNALCLFLEANYMVVLMLLGMIIVLINLLTHTVGVFG